MTTCGCFPFLTKLLHRDTIAILKYANESTYENQTAVSSSAAALHAPSAIPENLSNTKNTANRSSCDIWGSVFVLGDSNEVGLQSLHFISEYGTSEDWVYLSFEHPHCCNMKLYDGRPFPLIKIPFTSNPNFSDDDMREKEWNNASRTLKGWINIKEHCGSGVKGMGDYGDEVEITKWHFVLTFDENFERVIEGRKWRSYTGSNNCDIWSFESEYYGAHNKIYCKLGLGTKITK